MLRPRVLGILTAITLSACATARESVAPRSRPARCPSRVAPGYVSPFSYEQMILAERAAAHGQWSRAASLYRNTLETGEPDAYVLSRLAEALEQLGDRDGADAALDEALALDPCAQAAWVARARIARARGNANAAIEAYSQAARDEDTSGPSSGAAQLELAELLAEQGHHERARAVLATLAARRPAQAMHALRAALELALDGASAPEQLARAAEDWLALGGRAPGLNRRTAAELLRRGRPVLALRMLAAVPLSRQDASLRLSVLSALGRSDEAELLRATVPSDWLQPEQRAKSLAQRLEHAALPALAAELRASTRAR